MFKGRSEGQIIVAFLDWLLDRAFVTEVRPSAAKAELRKLRQAIAHVKKLRGGYADGAVSLLEKEEACLLAERQFRTYESAFMTRKSPKELGNIEETERLFVAVLIILRLNPKANPYIALKDQLEKRGDHRTPQALRLRVERFGKKRESSKYFSPRQIVEHHYLLFKWHVMWSGPFGQHLATTLEKLKTATSGDRKAGPLKPWPMRDFQKMQRLSGLTSRDRKLLDDLCGEQGKTRHSNTGN